MRSCRRVKWLGPDVTIDVVNSVRSTLTTAPRAAAREHMPCLDGLRGLAAVMVIFGHASDFGLPTIVDAAAGAHGVLIFFALSGFLMGDLYLRRTPTPAQIRGYAVARFARIVPIYYLVVLAGFAIHALDPAFAYAVTPVQLLRLLTFNGSVSVMWSIGPEVQFYVVFVALWLLYAWLRSEAAFAALVLALCALCLLTLRHWPGIFVASKFHIFALGMLAALLRHHLVGRLSDTAIAVSHGIALAIIVVFAVPGLAEALLGATPFDRATDPAFTSFYSSVPRIALAVFLALALSFQSRIGAFVFANSTAAMLGRCSFSIYLLHVPVYDVCMRTGVLAGLPGPLATVVVALLSIGAAQIASKLVEQPARDFLRTLLLRPSPRVAAAS